MKNSCRILLIFIAVTAAVFSFGCGKKTPPLPLPVEQVSEISDLSTEIAGETLILAWTVPHKTEPDKHISEFWIYRSKISMEGCKGCPVIFQKMAALANVPDKDGRMRYEDQLEKGYRYIYKITSVTDDGRRSQDSPWVERIYDPMEN